MDTPLDPREMRKAILACAHRGDRVDGKNSPYNMTMVAPIVRALVMSGEAQGWSGEDTMTALAYHALKRLEELYDAEVFKAVTMPAPSIVLTPKP